MPDLADLDTGPAVPAAAAPQALADVPDIPKESYFEGYLHENAGRMAAHEVPKEEAQKRLKEDVESFNERHGTNFDHEKVKEPFEKIYNAYQQDHDLSNARREDVERTNAAWDNPKNRSVTPSEVFARHGIPFISSLAGGIDKADYAESVKRYKAGTSTKEDYDRIAKYERVNKAISEVHGQGIQGGLIGAAAQAPAIVGELLTGGAVAKGAGAALGYGAKAGTILGSETAAGLALGGATRGAQTALAPSFYAEKAVDANLAAGRGAYDLKGFPAPLAYAYTQQLILGRMQNQVTTGNLLQQAGKKGIRGVAEQQVVDLLAGAVDNVLPEAYKFNTKWGVGGKLLKGDVGEAAKEAFVGMITFGAFAAAHGKTEVKDRILETGKDILDSAPKPEIGAEFLNAVHARFEEATQAKPDLTKSEARAQFEPLKLEPEERAHLDALIDSLPETVAEAQSKRGADIEAARAGRATGTNTPEADQMLAEHERATAEATREAAPDSPVTQTVTQTVPQTVQEAARAPEPPLLSADEIKFLRKSGHSESSIAKIAEAERQNRQRAEQVTGRAEAVADHALATNERIPEATEHIEGAIRSAENRLKQETGESEKSIQEELERASADAASRPAGEQAQSPEAPQQGTEGSGERSAGAEPAAATGTAEGNRAGSEGPSAREPQPERAARVASALTQAELADKVAGADFANNPSFGAMQFDPNAPIPGTIRDALVAQFGARAGEVWAKGAQAFRDGIKSIQNNIREFALHYTAPRTARLSENGAIAIAENNNTPVYSERAAKQFQEDILGPITGKEFLSAESLARLKPGEELSFRDKVDAGKRMYAAWLEMRLRYARGQFYAKADEFNRQANAEPDRGKRADLLKRADELYTQATNMPTLKGREGADMATEAEFQKTITHPAFHEFRERWTKSSGFTDTMEKFYKLAEGLEEGSKIDALTQLPDFPLPTLAIKEGDIHNPDNVVVPEPPSVRGSGRGGDPRLTRLGAARAFKGSAEGYNINPWDVIESTVFRRAANAGKANAYRVFSSEGLGSFDTAWQQKKTEDGRSYEEIRGVTPPRGTQDVPVDAKGKASFYVHPDSANEFKKSVDKTDPYSKVSILGIPIADAATKATLVSFIEGVSHATNLFTGQFNFDVKGHVETAKAIWDLTLGSKESSDSLKKEYIDLAYSGGGKGEKSEAGVLWGGKTDPTAWMSKALDVIDMSTRLAAAKVYDRHVAREGLQHSKLDKINFINQVGNYTMKSQNDLIIALRQTGWMPFATAASKFTAGGVQSLLGHSGLKADSLAGQAKIRASKLARIGAFAGTAAIGNALLWGRADGDDNTPTGALKVGTHNGKTAYIDLLALTGFTRGARLTGLAAMYEGWRANATPGQSAHRAKEDLGHGLMHPFMGPAPTLAYEAFTGHNTIGMPTAPKAKGDENQDLLNLQGALLNANPLVAGVTGADRPGPKQHEDTLEAANRMMLGKLGLKFRDKSPGRPLPKDR